MHWVFQAWQGGRTAGTHRGSSGKAWHAVCKETIAQLIQHRCMWTRNPRYHPKATEDAGTRPCRTPPPPAGSRDVNTESDHGDRRRKLVRWLAVPATERSPYG